MFSYIRGSPFSSPHFSWEGLTLPHKSLDIFQMYNLQNFIFPKLYFHIPFIFTALFLCKLNERENLLKNVYNSGCKFLQSGPPNQSTRQAGKCTDIWETFTSWHHDGVLFPQDSSIIYVKIHGNCSNQRIQNWNP